MRHVKVVTFPHLSVDDSDIKELLQHRYLVFFNYYLLCAWSQVQDDYRSWFKSFAPYTWARINPHEMLEKSPEFVVEDKNVQ